MPTPLIRNRARMGFVLLLVIPTLLGSCDRSPSYLDFMGRDEHYYASVAEGCDKLLEQAHVKPGIELKIASDDKVLPTVLMELKAKQFRVTANRVYAEIGPERAGGFGMAWEQSEEDKSVWRLMTSGDGLIKVMYTVKKPLRLGGPAPDTVMFK